MVELTKSNFREFVGTEGIVLVECWAPGCGACAQFDPVFEQAAEQHEGHSFLRMNLATDEKLGEFFEIEHTPCLMLYRDGLLLLKKPGNFSKKELDHIVAQAESLDMDAVRADLESSEDPSSEA
jgi:thiol-disulfide isomerase/thioredoxin